MCESTAPSGRYPKQWHLPSWKAVLQRPDVDYVDLDMCAFGLGPPDVVGQFYRHATRVVFPRHEPLRRALLRTCPGVSAAHVHVPLKGNRPGVPVSRCTEAGVYAADFVKSVVTCVLSTLTVGGGAGMVPRGLKAGGQSSEEEDHDEAEETRGDQGSDPASSRTGATARPSSRMRPSSVFGTSSTARPSSAFGTSSTRGTSSSLGTGPASGTSSAFGISSTCGTSSPLGTSSTFGTSSRFGTSSARGKSSALGTRPRLSVVHERPAEQPMEEAALEEAEEEVLTEDAPAEQPAEEAAMEEAAEQPAEETAMEEAEEEVLTEDAVVDAAKNSQDLLLRSLAERFMGNPSVAAAIRAGAISTPKPSSSFRRRVARRLMVKRASGEQVVSVSFEKEKELAPGRSILVN